MGHFELQLSAAERQRGAAERRSGCDGGGRTTRAGLRPRRVRHVRARVPQGVPGQGDAHGALQPRPRRHARAGAATPSTCRRRAPLGPGAGAGSGRRRPDPGLVVIPFQFAWPVGAAPSRAALSGRPALGPALPAAPSAPGSQAPRPLAPAAPAPRASRARPGPAGGCRGRLPRGPRPATGARGRRRGGCGPRAGRPAACACVALRVSVWVRRRGWPGPGRPRRHAPRVLGLVRGRAPAEPLRARGQPAPALLFPGWVGVGGCPGRGAEGLVLVGWWQPLPLVQTRGPALEGPWCCDCLLSTFLSCVLGFVCSEGA